MVGQNNLVAASLLVVVFLGLGTATNAAQKGMMLATYPKSTQELEQDVRALAELGATLVRFPIYFSYVPSLEEWLNKADAILTLCEQLGITLVIDFHHPTDNVGGSDIRDVDDFVAKWQSFATRFRDRGDLWYDLCNEPNHANWRQVAQSAAKAIREIDPVHPIVFAPRGSTTSSANHFTPLDGISDQILQFHFYDWECIQFPPPPLEELCERLPSTPNTCGKAKRYPSRNRTKKDLRDRLARVRNAGIAHQVPVYIGEVAIWNRHPNAPRFLRDFAAICDEMNINLTVHAYRESCLWDYEANPRAWNEIIKWLRVGVADAGQEAKGPDWCRSEQVWKGKGIAATALIGCPIEGTCDTPSERDNWIPDASTPIRTVHIHFNIFSESDGSNPAATKESVDGQMVQLNSDFAPARVQFCHTIAFIRDSRYRYFDQEFQEEEMKNTYAKNPSEQLNVYVVDDLSLSSFAVFPWDPQATGNLGGIVMHDRSFGPGKSVLTHEVGHCLGLWHTHHGVSEFDPMFDSCFEDFDACDCACYERAGGANADTTGDFASDTAPTPVNNSCRPPRGRDRCNGVSWGSTDVENYMGYSKSCWSEFSPQQFGRMHCWSESKLTAWACGPITATGACCNGATCSIETEPDCSAAAGIYLGDGTNCAGQCAEPLAAPSSLVARRDDSTPELDVVVTWVNNDARATGTNIAYSFDGNNWNRLVSVEAGATQHRTTNHLQHGVRIYLVARAVLEGPDKTIYSEYSNVDSAIPRYLSLARPSNLVAARDDSTPELDVVISWTNNDARATGTNIAYSFDGMNWNRLVSVGPGVTQHRTTNHLQHDLRISFAARAVLEGPDEIVYSEYSNVDSAIPRYLSLAPPSNLVAARDDSTPELDVVITWTNNDARATGTNIAYSFDGINWNHLVAVAPGISQHRTTRYLQSGRRIYYKARAKLVGSEDTIYSDYSNIDAAIPR